MINASVINSEVVRKIILTFFSQLGAILCIKSGTLQILLKIFFSLGTQD